MHLRSELAALNERELQALSLEMGGSALCLKEKDMHVSIAGLVSASQPLMDMAASLVAMQNGRKISTTKSAASPRFRQIVLSEARFV